MFSLVTASGFFFNKNRKIMTCTNH